MTEATKRRRPSILNVDIGPLKPALKAWCEGRGVSASEAVREFLAAALIGERMIEAAPAVRAAGALRRHSWKRIEISLTPQAYNILAETAGREGMSPSRWLASLARMRLTGEPQFSADELQALMSANQAVLALGRNVNQIARRLNERLDSDPLTLAQIDYLRDAIEEHKKALRSLLNANSRRWRA